MTTVGRLAATAAWISRRRVAILAVLASITFGAGGWWSWSRYVSPTRIALVNFRDFQVAEMLEANRNGWIRLERIDLDKLAATDLRRYDAAFLFGRGLNLDSPQQAAVRAAIVGGTRVYVDGATNVASDVTDLAGDDLKYVSACFENGGRKNLASLFNYARRVLAGKTLFSEAVAEPQVIPQDVLFHIGEGRFFTDVKEYQAFYESSKSFKPGRPKVCLLSSIFGPRSPNRGSLDVLIERLEAKGLNVYPIAGFRKRLDAIKAIGPDLVVSIPHGRLAPGRADEAIRYLEEQGIPLLCPIGVFESHEKWLGAQKGMEGGMLSQNVVMPELDGGVEPFTISAQFPNERGLYVPKAIPERVETFVARVERWLTLRRKPNAEKKLAIVYYKGPGQNAMAAAALEVAPSLLNLLKRLQAEGYDTGPLPDSIEEFQARVQRQGPVLGAYAEGAFAEFLEKGDPEWIKTEDYREWARTGLAAEAFAAVEKQYGPAPGAYLTARRDGESYLALPRCRFGNVVILPQLLPALGDDASKLVHGAKAAPPHPYLATYLWARYGFKADALMHFGTHGSLEFTPWKQNALSQLDWPDALVGDLPHVYLYIINNIGEAIIAKRRSYATLVSHLTPPFTESELYGPLKQLQDAIGSFQSTTDPALRQELVTTITRLVHEQKLHKDLEFEADSESEAPLTEDQIEKVHDYLMTVGLEKIMRGLYTLGVPMTPEQAVETARLMAVDAVSTARARLDRAAGKVDQAKVDDPKSFDEQYHRPAFATLDLILSGKAAPDSFLDRSDLARLERWEQASRTHTQDESPANPRRSGKANESAAGESGGRGRSEGAVRREGLSEAEREYAGAVSTLRNALTSVSRYRDDLLASTAREQTSLIAALNGRYIPPSSGGDAVTNPDAVPTGRNLTAIDAERTPSAEAWRVGGKLAEETIQAKIKETGAYPKKVALSLWAGEFINSQGVDVAIILHLLGVEPVRNARGEVHDVRLIPAAALKRPRIDVVVQTSGQLRDVAASRLALIDKAVKLASAAPDGPGTEANYVLQGTLAAESVMKEKGLSPAEAKTFSTARIFGGVNGNYGTGIMGLVESGDRWESDREIADQYLKNMGAVYTGDHWGHYAPGLFEGALQNTDTLLHSRTSNLNGPLSLDHVYEFMGGLNATIRNVTGRDPDAYFADMRNKHKTKVQEAKEAFWTEARSTVLNPKYIKELQAGGASSAAVFAETLRNTYGWNVMKPDAVDDELWNELYAVYVEDREKLGLRESFARTNPYALQEMTAVMLETARKGLWHATPDQARAVATLHADLVRDHKPGCSGFVCDNAKLRQSIDKLLGPDSGKAYLAAIDRVREGDRNSGGEPTQNMRGLTLERQAPAAQKAESSSQALTPATLAETSNRRQSTATLAAAGAAALLLGLLGSGYLKRRS